MSLALVVLCVAVLVSWFGRAVIAVVCECPYQRPDHPTEGTAE